MQMLIAVKASTIDYLDYAVNKMRILFIALMCILLGSCINNKVNLPPEEGVIKVDPARLCLQLEEKVDYLTIAISQMPHAASLPKPPPATSCKQLQIYFEPVPIAPNIVITENDGKDELISHIDTLLTHIEDLQRYIENEHKALKK